MPLPSGAEWEIYLADDPANWADGATKQRLKDWSTRANNCYRGDDGNVTSSDFGLAADGGVFDGSNDRGISVGTNGWAGVTACSALVVFKPTAVGTLGCMLATGSHGNLGNFGLCVGAAAGAISVEYYANSCPSASGLVSNNTWYCFVATKAPGPINTTTVMYLNNKVVPATGGASTGTPSIGNDNANLIGIFTGGGIPFQGTIAAVIMWKRTLTPAEAGEAYATIKAKLASTGVTLPSASPDPATTEWVPIWNPASAQHVIEDEGIVLPQRNTINFTGAGVVATDAGGKTVVTIAGGTAPVTSVFTRTGAIVAQAGDYTAALVTNSVSTLGSYADPTWITSLAYSKLTGVPSSFTPATHTHAAADITTGIMDPARLGTGTPTALNYLRGDGVWTSVPVNTIVSVFGRTGAVVAVAGDYTAALVTNSVSTIGSYADPAWITSLAWSKITGAPAAGSQTPWLQHVNAANFNLTNLGYLMMDHATNVMSIEMRSAGALAFTIQRDPGGAANTQLTSFGTGSLVFNTPSERMRITAAGLVGIGKTPATYKLEVSGDIDITGIYRINGTPISTGGSQTPWTSNIAGANYSLGNVATLGIGTANITYPLTMRVGVDKIFIFSDTGTASMQVLNDAINTLVPMTYAASNHIFSGGPIVVVNPVHPTSYAGAAMVVINGSPTGAPSALQLQIGESTQNPGYRLQIGYTQIGTVSAWMGCIQAISGGVAAPLGLNPGGGITGIGYTPNEARAGTMLSVIRPTNPAGAAQATQLVIAESGNNLGYQFQLGYSVIGGAWWAGCIQSLAGGGGCPLLVNPLGGPVIIGAEFSYGAGLHVVKGGVHAGPPANTGTYGTATLIVGGSAAAYGMLLESLDTGTGYIQMQRGDTTLATYPLSLQPNGGATCIGTLGPWPSFVCHVRANLVVQQGDGGATVLGHSANTTPSGTGTIAIYYDMASNTGRLDCVTPYVAWRHICINVGTGTFVGINTASPIQTLHVNGGIYSINGYFIESADVTSMYQGAPYYGYGRNNVTGYTQMAGYSGLVFVTGSLSMTMTSYLSLGPNLTSQKLAVYESGATFLGFGVQSQQLRYITSSSCLHFWYHGTTPLMSLTATGLLGIGMGGTQTYQIQLSGDSAAKTSTNTWYIASDARLKRNIRDLTGGLDIITKLRPVVAEYNGLGGTPDGARVVSFLAHEIRDILPHTVNAHRGRLRDNDPEDSDILDFNLHEVLIHLVLAVKQLSAKVDGMDNSG